MPKTKKPKKAPKILVPFKYEDDSFMSECGSSEGQSYKSWWDTIEKCWADVSCWKRNKPQEEIWKSGHGYHNYYDRKLIANPNYEAEMKIYEAEMKKYEEKVKDVDSKKLSGRYIEVNQVIWKDNFEFKDTFYIESYTGRGASKSLVFTSQITGNKYNMNLNDLVVMLQNTSVIDGVVSGTWTFSRLRGRYGIAFVSP
jgi:hypothetical protein